MSIKNNEKTVFTLIDNQIDFNPDGKYDRNYGLHSLEVVDDKLIPQIQIYLEEGNKIYIGGVIKATNGKFIILGPSYMKTTLDEQQVPTIVKRLFNYPSSDNLGVEIKENRPDFSSINKEISFRKELDNKFSEFSKLPNAELSNKALKLADSIQDLENRYKAASELKMSYEERVKSDPTRLIFNEYDQKYKSVIMALVEVIALRVPQINSSELQEIRLNSEYPTNGFGLNSLTISLRQLAGGLKNKVNH